MGRTDSLRTMRYQDHADRSYGRMGYTTLRRTGLEAVLNEANGRNLDALSKFMPEAEFRRVKDRYGPEGIWNEVKARNLASFAGATKIIPMSLGDPSAYENYLSNVHVPERMAELVFAGATSLRETARYTGSFGFPPLREKLRSVTFADPRSIRKDPSRFSEVEVYVTAGASDATEFAMGPLLLTPADTLLVHDWTYIIHLGAAYFRGAHVDSYNVRADGRPDAASLSEALRSSRSRGDREIQAVVFTPIGNPVGAAMTREDIAEHLRIISDEGKRQNRPIMAIVDIAYEPFRRDGAPLDPIEIAMGEGIPGPMIVLDTASKGYGLCGWRIGKLAVHWPKGHFPDHRHDYLKALENRMLPKLGVVSVPAQMAFDNFFDMLRESPELLEQTIGFFETRRAMVNGNLVHIAESLREMPGVYLAKYYDHGGTNGGLDPTTLSSFYLLFGFSRLLQREGSGFNQVVAFGEHCLRTEGLPVVNCVPGSSFLPFKRWPNHPALIRVTGLTSAEDTEAFIGAVRSYAAALG